MAPVAVEPRKINPAGKKDLDPPEQVEGEVVAAADPPPAKGAADEETGGSSPLIPILAGIVGVVVLGLLVKVLKAK